MLELLSSGLVSLWLEMAGLQIKPLDALDALAWQSSPGLVLAPDPNPASANTVQEYLKGLITSKLIAQNLTASQGIWMQSGPMLMANHEGTTPLPAASLTKIATSLVAFKTWGPDHQFETVISATGPVTNGVLQGDLVVNGGGDPMMVWEEAIAIGNALNKMGIKQVKGNLVITGSFAMNFQRHPLLAGQLFKQALNSATWTRPAIYTYSIMPKGTPKPQVAIAGTVKVEPQANPQQAVLIRHLSLPMRQIIKEMNVYSNNDIAEMLAESVGGHTVVQATAAKLARVPEGEIQLINGSGLGPENRISPRAVCAMLMAIQQESVARNLTLADLFPMSGFDHRGTLHARHMPAGTVMKTGTLRDVSALAGVMPTRDRGLVWFAIINRGNNVSGFRTGQDQLLQRLVQKLQVAPQIPAALTPHSTINTLPELGANSRNQILFKS
ncbi:MULTISPECIES: D-alanyl-D-alanine carboxypeptidase [unclassified Tolypothrix]|uniref:D-alanyl-D-alanine carboxypeptidase n=1 Tax=unclassified Tolypothrix TaxID=2649714 RepID=UPI0005EAC676|nr:MULTISPECIES: D-alanyl-D-alanine carboxypeptidase [unclassified Tolypothrix]BAY93956.1 peptidase S13, D-Ala-D-Ala carboxypeptidase C [Microchaete diplosiphon NIES-3275]EKF03536.1 putative D-alanyl-D-alanine carboxypeptidase/D-alanyl-D-alanine-endopeptidase [Tolypothrix sp. PCC 7601]MBE9085699.1 D-alanyl-D-alanine carboxypeptidase [Tolypothrix sp. LEGE 11397]UYD27733.1 D-alanyl-D-alanine carboxypeptidase [Tolypothrix sp. PCC 7712]UYD36404.1 D-alanyl-D-alanine carboxypeptidase [Tolypothrix sp